MKACQVNILTTVNGTTGEVRRKGSMELAETAAEIVYQDEGAEVVVKLQDGTLSIDRRGDYDLLLNFKQGEKCECSLGIDGSQGILHTKTEKLMYTISGDRFLLVLHYTLYTGGDPQAMQIRMTAKKAKGEI